MSTAMKPASAAVLDGDPPMQADTDAQRRARFFNSGNAFNLKLPSVPRARFDAERDAAFAEDAASGLFAMDQSDAFGGSFPATTPLVLARYIRVTAGDTVTTAFIASGEVIYAIVGSGTTTIGSETISWGPGDVMVLPGGQAVSHTADGDAAAVLWVVTNEPVLAFEGLRAPSAESSQIDPVHYPADEIARQIEVLTNMPTDENTAGVALIFSSERTADSRNAMPSMTLAMNTLAPGHHQRPHKHNAAAITLCVDGPGCFSMIDGHRIDWSPFSTMVTPPAEVHSHHNGGAGLARFLIVQDGGLHYYARTMGFAFSD
ncbi:cupin domain-containing protein [Thalassobaculum sp. OXR-137]|uniref:cupin domain-containing protein n=1 Tax=Thalassobaculum sp. OXR-137 TaxID=3100173 RepID=UPI002AC99BA0|nr:cupin domain-containing protein [Thalassobaculum sp. OXR-137]WPZ35731.1 cupin domain-containing protein [Thalassobaculum sp. OXR-137]